MSYNGYPTQDAFHEALAAGFAEYAAEREAAIAANPAGFAHEGCDHAYGICSASPTGAYQPRETPAPAPAPVDNWTPQYSRWRHGGWYVDNVRYPSGAVGCVSRNYPDRKWRIVCDRRPFDEAPTFASRDAAARAERDLARAERNPEPWAGNATLRRPDGTSERVHIVSTSPETVCYTDAAGNEDVLYTDGRAAGYSITPDSSETAGAE